MKVEDFKIEHIDPQGQGVSKLTDKTTFIAKVLPGETGTIKITHEKSKIKFGEIKELKDSSPHRITPECPHFNDCNGCHYLHTDYEQEISFKLDSYKRMLKKFINNPSIICHKSHQRFHTRNRIQLHYDKKKNLLGYHKAYSNEIMPAPQCQLPNLELTHKLEDIYKNWQKLTKNEKDKGHIEIYMRNGEINVSINKPYAASGFTQVHEQLNQKMIDVVSTAMETNEEGLKTLDLFGGSGNLSAKLTNQKVIVIDATPEKLISLKTHQKYQKMNLYDKKSIQSILSLGAIDQLIIDPPRSGFKELAMVIESLKPKNIFYISCNPWTLIRDLEPVSNDYHFSQIHMFDLFPGSFHFEAGVFLTKNS